LYDETAAFTPDFSALIFLSLPFDIAASMLAWFQGNLAIKIFAQALLTTSTSECGSVEPASVRSVREQPAGNSSYRGGALDFCLGGAESLSAAVSASQFAAAFPAASTRASRNFRIWSALLDFSIIGFSTKGNASPPEGPRCSNCQALLAGNAPIYFRRRFESTLRLKVAQVQLYPSHERTCDRYYSA
jgi:hypothetical protein